jgi:hypothetical protein
MAFITASFGIPATISWSSGGMSVVRMMSGGSVPSTSA